MAKDNEKEILEENLEDKDTEVSPRRQKACQVRGKAKKADDKIDELSDQIDKLREDIKNQPDQKAKNKLRKQRDELIAQREGIYTSKDGMTIPMSKKNKNIIKSVIAIVLIAVLLCVYIVTGAARHGLLSYFGVPQDTLTAYTITDGDGNSHNIKVSTYNYYFAVEYNNLRQKKSTYSQYSAQYGLDLSSMKLDVDFEKSFQSKQPQTTTAKPLLGHSISTTRLRIISNQPTRITTRLLKQTTVKSLQSQMTKRKSFRKPLINTSHRLKRQVMLLTAI